MAAATLPTPARRIVDVLEAIPAEADWEHSLVCEVIAALEAAGFPARAELGLLLPAHRTVFDVIVRVWAGSATPRKGGLT